MNKYIIEFIKKQTCATVCCVDENGNPYCFSCFFVFNEDNGLLYFKSSISTHHSSILLNKTKIAGTILQDKLNNVLIKGIQFEGLVLSDDHPLAQNSDIYYYKKNPAGLAKPGQIWTIQIENIKLTDSTLGFGKKITWHRNSEILQ